MTKIKMLDHEDISLFSVRDKPWSYRAEGNGNLVISLPNMGKILRLVKSEETKSSSTTTSDGSFSQLQEGTADLHQLISFIEDTIGSLLGRNFVQPGEIVRIASDELVQLNDQLHSLRPESRRHKTLGQKDTLAFLQPDHCSPFEPSAYLMAKGLKPVGAIVTVEIKPKMGFLSTRSEVSARSSTKEVCKYHLMQLWKLKQGKIAKVSAYCPLDLFSGCRSRMTNCLRQLLLNPQNNFRIFINGALVYGENLEDRLADVSKEIFPDVADPNLAVNRLFRLLIEALLFDHALDDVHVDIQQSLRLPCASQVKCQCKTYNDNPFETPNDSCKYRCQVDDGQTRKCALPKGCMLSRLLAAQMLHTADAISLRSACCRLQSTFEGLPPELMTRLLYGSHADYDESAQLNDVPNMKDGDVRQIRRYLLSCTARDCSIMLKLCQLENEFDVAFHSLLPPGQFIITDMGDGVAPESSFLCSLVFVDLDWKPLSRVLKHADEEAALYDHWASRQSTAA